MSRSIVDVLNMSNSIVDVLNLSNSIVDVLLLKVLNKEFHEILMDECPFQSVTSKSSRLMYNVCL